MCQKVYLAYNGDEVELGTEEEFDAGMAINLASRVMEDIVADMKSNYADKAEITISIR